MVRCVAADESRIRVDGVDVRITSPGKVFFPATGHTKLDLVEYYLAVAEPFLRAMQDRPTLMQRFPDGAGGKSFFQKRVPQNAPEWIVRTVVSTPNGTTSEALTITGMASVIWALNLGCIGFHPWPYRAGDPANIDELRIDLDPQPGVTFDEVRDAGVQTRGLLDELGIRSFVKTTGSRGLHVYVRLQQRWDAYEVRAGALALARELERRHPKLITSAWWKEERGRRVFVDFNQNAPHKTMFGPWSVRPRITGDVSTPFAWSELDTVAPDALTIATVPARVAAAGGPWREMNDVPQDLSPLLDMAERDEAAGLGDAPWPPVYPKMPGEPTLVSSDGD
jgi:DNA ligase D